jgi:hypothetical protein
VHDDFCPNPTLSIYDLERAASKHWRDLLRAGTMDLRQKK